MKNLNAGPVRLRIKKVADLASQPIIWSFNWLFSSLVYFGGVGITALTAKILRKKFLAKKKDDTQNSYWVAGSENHDYSRQF